jgi:hypothetical protein
MSKGLREHLQGTAGKVVAVGVVVVALVGAAWAARNFFGASPEQRYARDRTFVCAETGKPFEYTIKKGDLYPVPSPHSGKNTGYPAELCFWTADGKVKSEPTPVLMNVYTGKKGATFCPDCGRLVVPFNPMAREGEPPPPKQSEYKARRGVSADESPESNEPK